MEIQVYSGAWRDFEKKGAGRGYGAFSASEIPSVSYYQFQCGKKYRYRCDLTPAAYPGKRITGGEGGREEKINSVPQLWRATARLFPPPRLLTRFSSEKSRAARLGFPLNPPCNVYPRHVVGHRLKRNETKRGGGEKTNLSNRSDRNFNLTPRGEQRKREEKGEREREGTNRDERGGGIGREIEAIKGGLRAGVKARTHSYASFEPRRVFLAPDAIDLVCQPSRKRRRKRMRKGAASFSSPSVHNATGAWRTRDFCASPFPFLSFPFLSRGGRKEMRCSRPPTPPNQIQREERSLHLLLLFRVARRMIDEMDVTQHRLLG